MNACSRNSQLGMVVPVFFRPDVYPVQVERLLKATFLNTSALCDPHNVVAVVDEKTTAQKVLLSLQPDLEGIRVETLERNRGKTGAVERGLRRLLDHSGVRWLATRDCDGEHAVEDLPRMLALGRKVEDEIGSGPVVVIGARASPLQSMGWLRTEWEALTNRLLMDLLALSGTAGSPAAGPAVPDLQSGYRLYNREAARLAADFFRQVEDDYYLLLFACEFLSFASLVRRGTVFRQIEYLTPAEPVVSSYSGLNFAEAYSTVLRKAAEMLSVSEPTLLRVFDRRLEECRIYFSDRRADLLTCRRLLGTLTVRGESPDGPCDRDL